jgi:AcrR family transcriptional regulator
MGIEERKERERKARIKQIQNAAKKVFLEKSFRTATIEDIAKEAELSPAAIYLFFKSKDDLYVSLSLLSAKAMLKEVNAICNNKQLEAESKLLELKRVLLRKHRYDHLIFPHLLFVQTVFSIISGDTLAELQDITRQIQRGVNSIFEQGIREGRFMNINPIAQADIVWGLFSGLALWENSKKLFSPNKDHLETTLDLAFEILCRGIAKTNTDKAAVQTPVSDCEATDPASAGN